MPKLPDNHPDKWNYDLHTWVKHQILVRYLSPWTTILGSREQSIAYVDGFAGRGRYTSGEPGSPLRVLTAIQEALASRRAQTKQVVCHFIEANDDNFANLRSEVESHPALSDGRIACRFYHSKFSSVSSRIIDEIAHLRQPSFFFVDPFGYDVPMDVLSRVLRLPMAEVFVNVMFNFINRAMGVEENPALAATLDRLVGSPDWRSISRLSGTQREQAFIALYRQKLKYHGAKHVIPFRMEDDARERTLYYLVYATKHPRGANVMKDAMVLSGTRGQLGYAGQERHPLIPLFDLHVNQLPSFLLQRFIGQTLSFDDIVAQTIDETGTCRESDYRACLKELEARGSIAIDRASSKTSRGLTGKDRITFLQMQLL